MYIIKTFILATLLYPQLRVEFHDNGMAYLVRQGNYTFTVAPPAGRRSETQYKICSTTRISPTVWSYTTYDAYAQAFRSGALPQCSGT